MEPLYFAVKHRDPDVRRGSRSGGVFTAVSDTVLSQGGVVYGCVMNDKLEAVHCRAETKAERDQMRGSKYVQSRMDNVYARALEDLKAGRTVLFTGTPCQIAGLNRLCGGEKRLYTAEILCQGTPSPGLLREFLKLKAGKSRGPAKRIDFRNKDKYGWGAQVLTLYFEDGSSLDDTLYTGAFYKQLSVRPSCGKCPFKRPERQADITMGDFWGIERAGKGIKDEYGVSLMILNTEKGLELLREQGERLEGVEFTWQDCVQPVLLGNAPPNPVREKFWRLKAAKGLGEALRRYAKMDIRLRLKWRLKAVYLKIKRGREN